MRSGAPSTQWVDDTRKKFDALLPWPLRSVESIGWVLPIDDTHFRNYVAGAVHQTGVARGLNVEAAQRFADGGNFIAA